MRSPHRPSDPPARHATPPLPRAPRQTLSSIAPSEPTRRGGGGHVDSPAPDGRGRFVGCHGAEPSVSPFAGGAAFGPRAGDQRDPMDPADRCVPPALTFAPASFRCTHGARMVHAWCTRFFRVSGQVNRACAGAPRSAPIPTIYRSGRSLRRTNRSGGQARARRHAPPGRQASRRPGRTIRPGSGAGRARSGPA